jgi:mono/diheme cytochrome c family protein
VALAALAVVIVPWSGAHEDRPVRAARVIDASGVATRGLARIQELECSRCHHGTGAPDPPEDKHCFDCHMDIDQGDVAVPDGVLPQWQARVRPLRAAPSLAASGERYRRGWIERYLLDPRDLRPHLVPTMPRLPITPEDARDIATYLAPDDEPPLDLESADPGRGRALLDAKGCGACHLFTGAPPLSARPPAPAGDTPLAVALAPDLRSTRERLRADWLIAWLRDPSEVKPGTPMPTPDLDEGEARDVAAYLLTVPLDPPPQRPAAARLPVLERRVAYEEVSARVLKRTCWHCHAEPDSAIGDAGPGSTGGFGFAPRRLNLASYEGVASGLLNAEGERASVFAPRQDGTPLLVAALLARSEEEAGRPMHGVRGMPLGLPPLSPEDIQLVETWVSQGRPQ